MIYFADTSVRIKGSLWVTGGDVAVVSMEGSRNTTTELLTRRVGFHWGGPKLFVTHLPAPVPEEQAKRVGGVVGVGVGIGVGDDDEPTVC